MLCATINCTITSRLLAGFVMTSISIHFYPLRKVVANPWAHLSVTHIPLYVVRSILRGTNGQMLNSLSVPSFPGP